MSVKCQEFSSLYLLHEFIRNYESENYVQLYKRDSRSIEKMKTVCPLKLKTCNPELKYYSITYTCKKGGKQFKSESSGLRRSSTYRGNCPMTIKFVLNNDGTKLQIVHMVENHNHPVNRELFQKMPKQRKLEPEEKMEAIKMLNMRCNLKLVQSFLQEKTGKPVQLKDLKNLRSAGKYSQSDIKNVIKLLTQNDGIALVVVNDKKKLLGIYHQTPYMKNCFATYPELMLLGATYKLSTLDMSLYVLMSINGNNEGEVIAIFLLSDESRHVIRHMMRTFKNCNPEWDKIKTIMTDKDLGAKTVLYEEFPDASHQLCLLHVLKCFRTAITAKSMKITTTQRKKILEILQKIVFSKSEAQYDEYCNRLMNLGIPNLKHYYEKNWHYRKHEWVQCYKEKQTTFNVKTSNHLESFYQKIKQVCEKFSNLESFFENFSAVLNSIKLKRQQTVHDMLLKTSVSCFAEESPESFYLKVMTPFAFNLICGWLKKVDDFDVTIEGLTLFQVCEKGHNENMHTVEIDLLQSNPKCSCSFSVSTTLPCTHIFAAMLTMGKNLFKESLIPDRFLKSIYINCYKNKNITVDGVGTKNDRGSKCDVKAIKPKKLILNSQQKYKVAVSKCEKIASIISNLNMNDFRTHCDQLDSIINLWSQRKQTVITQLSETEQTEYVEGQIVTACNEQKTNNKTQHSEKTNKLLQDLENDDKQMEKDDTEMGEILGLPIDRIIATDIDYNAAEGLETDQTDYVEDVTIVMTHNEQEADKQIKKEETKNDENFSLKRTYKTEIDHNAAKVLETEQTDYVEDIIIVMTHEQESDKQIKKEETENDENFLLRRIYRTEIDHNTIELLQTEQTESRGTQIIVNTEQQENDVFNPIIRLPAVRKRPLKGHDLTLPVLGLGKRGRNNF